MLAAASAVKAIAATHCPIFRKTPPTCRGPRRAGRQRRGKCHPQPPFDALFGTFPACSCPCLLRSAAHAERPPVRFVNFLPASVKSQWSVRRYGGSAPVAGRGTPLQRLRHGVEAGGPVRGEGVTL